MGQPINVLLWKPEDIERALQALLKSIRAISDWKWEVTYHPDEDGESIPIDYWQLRGKSKENRLELAMVLGRVPWVTRTKLEFTKEGQTYTCDINLMRSSLAMRELDAALDAIARKIKGVKDEQGKREQERGALAWAKEQARQAQRLINSLTRRFQ